MQPARNGRGGGDHAGAFEEVVERDDYESIVLHRGGGHHDRLALQELDFVLGAGGAVVEDHDCLGLPLADHFPAGLEVRLGAFGRDVLGSCVLADEVADTDAADRQRRSVTGVVEERANGLHVGDIQSIANGVEF